MIAIRVVVMFSKWQVDVVVDLQQVDGPGPARVEMAPISRTLGLSFGLPLERPGFGRQAGRVRGAFGPISVSLSPPARPARVMLLSAEQDKANLH